MKRVLKIFGVSWVGITACSVFWSWSHEKSTQPAAQVTWMEQIWMACSTHVVQVYPQIVFARLFSDYICLTSRGLLWYTIRPYSRTVILSISSVVSL
jgi:hypothetical protein